jgi:hypothetical protein
LQQTTAAGDGTLLKVASFPRKRESIGLTTGPRFRGDDADIHCLGLATVPWGLLGMTAFCQFSIVRWHILGFVSALFKMRLPLFSMTSWLRSHDFVFFSKSYGLPIPGGPHSNGPNPASLAVGRSG